MSAAYVAYTEAMAKAGVVLGGNRLRPTRGDHGARQDGKTKVLDGPYADTKEQLGGYYMIDVPDLDAALSWAARCPSAANGTIEVRADLADAVIAASCSATRTRARPPRRSRAQSYGKLVAYLAARTRDVAAAEDALSDAFAAALADWPASGVPQQPGSLAAGGGAPQGDRCGAPAAQPARARRSSCA